MKTKEELFVCGLVLAAVSLLAGTPSFAATTVGFTVSNVGGGVYEYLWTVGYDGSNPTGFGQLEVYLPTKMNSATNDLTTLNGANLVAGSPTPYDPTGPIVTYPWNALHYDAGHTDWTQARINLETPDQEGFDPPLGEIAFFTNGQDTAAGIYQFSYRLDQNLTSFFYELHDASEADVGVFQSGTVPEPSALAFLALALFGGAGLRRRSKK